MLKDWRPLLLGLLLLLAGCATPQVASKKVDSKIALAATYHAQLGIGYLQQGNTARAKEKLIYARELAPNLPLVQYSLGYFYEMTGQIPEAEQAFLEAIRLDSVSGEVHNNFGAFLCRQGRYVEAEREFLLAIQDTSYIGSAKAYENAGLCALEKGTSDKAYRYFSQALLQDPSLPHALLELANLDFGQNKLEQAENYLHRYKLVSTNTPRSLWLEIQIADKVGDSNRRASLALLLKHTFPASKEASLLAETMAQ